MGTAFLCAFHPLFLCFFLTFSVYIFLIHMNVQTFRSLVLQAGQQGLRRKKSHYPGRTETQMKTEFDEEE